MSSEISLGELNSMDPAQLEAWWATASANPPAFSSGMTAGMTPITLGSEENAAAQADFANGQTLQGLIQQSNALGDSYTAPNPNTIIGYGTPAGTPTASKSSTAQALPSSHGVTEINAGTPQSLTAPTPSNLGTSGLSSNGTSSSNPSSALSLPTTAPAVTGLPTSLLPFLQQSQGLAGPGQWNIQQGQQSTLPQVMLNALNRPGMPANAMSAAPQQAPGAPPWQVPPPPPLQQAQYQSSPAMVDQNTANMQQPQETQGLRQPEQPFPFAPNPKDYKQSMEFFENLDSRQQDIRKRYDGQRALLYPVIQKAVADRNEAGARYDSLAQEVSLNRRAIEDPWSRLANAEAKSRAYIAQRVTGFQNPPKGQYKSYLYTRQSLENRTFNPHALGARQLRGNFDYVQQIMTDSLKVKAMWMDPENLKRASDALKADQEVLDNSIKQHEKVIADCEENLKDINAAESKEMNQLNQLRLGSNNAAQRVLGAQRAEEKSTMDALNYNYKKQHDNRIIPIRQEQADAAKLRAGAYAADVAERKQHHQDLKSKDAASTAHQQAAAELDRTRTAQIIADEKASGNTLQVPPTPSAIDGAALKAALKKAGIPPAQAIEIYKQTMGIK